MAAQETTTTRSSFGAQLFWYILGALVILTFGSMLYFMWRPVVTGQPLATPTAPAGNVGGQAPASLRGSNPDPVLPTAAIATPIPGIAQNEAESLRSYQATVQAANSAPAAAPTLPPAPLPLNSAGAPVIDAQQQQQLDLSAQLAADEQQAALLAAQLADAANRAPDVSKADAEQMLHRDLCSVPRANPHTCQQGLFKPTPIGAP